MRGFELGTELFVSPDVRDELPLLELAAAAGRTGVWRARVRSELGVPRLDRAASLPLSLVDEVFCFLSPLVVTLRLDRFGAMRPLLAAVRAAKVLPELAPVVIRRMGSWLRLRPVRSSIFFRVARVSCRAS